MLPVGSEHTINPDLAPVIYDGRDAEIASLRALLVRIRAWDVLRAPDGGEWAWQGAIDAALAGTVEGN